jgi:hypothetical protein
LSNVQFDDMGEIGHCKGIENYTTTSARLGWLRYAVRLFASSVMFLDGAMHDRPAQHVQRRPGPQDDAG